MSNLNNPSSGPVTGLAFELFGLLSTPFDVWNVAMLFYGFQGWRTGVTGIGAQMFVPSLRWIGSLDRNAIKHSLQLRHIMPIGSCHDERQRDATTVHQQMALASIFFPDRSDSVRRFVEPWALSSSIHQCFAIAKRCRQIHHIRQGQASTMPQRHPPSPIQEIGREWRWHCRNARQAMPSTDTRCAAHRRSLQRPISGLWVCVHP